MSKFYNVIGSSFAGGKVVTELIPPTEDNDDIKSILLTNVHSTDTEVSLFIQDDPSSGSTSTYHIIYAVNIPPTTSLLLDEPSMFKFDTFYGLYLKVGNDDKIDVIINN